MAIVAGIPGGALLPLYEALGRSTSIRHILARHEQAAGFIAQGMARITGKAGVCFATSGPGVTNVVTALADAKLDSIPLVCIAGQVPTALIGTDAFQEVPTIDMVRPITKASFFVRNASELWHVIPEAFRIAESGRPGPVLIDVPKDIQLQLADREPTSHEAPALSVLPASPRHEAIPMLDASRHFDIAAQMIHAAQRPVLYVGGGIVKARAHAAIRKLAERAGLPVTTTLMALGCLPAGHALDIGMLGMHGARYTNLVIDECDLLIAIGARFDDRATGDPRKFAPHARIIHIDIDPREFGKIKPADLAICADAGLATQELLNRVPPTRRTLWLSRVNQLKHGHPLQTPDIHRSVFSVWDRAGGGRDRACRCHRDHRCGPASDVGGATLPVRAAGSLADFGRPGHHGLRPASRDRRGIGGARRDHAVLHWRRQFADERAGTGDASRAGFECENRAAR